MGDAGHPDVAGDRVAVPLQPVRADAGAALFLHGQLGVAMEVFVEGAQLRRHGVEARLEGLGERIHGCQHQPERVKTA